MGKFVRAYRHSGKELANILFMGIIAQVANKGHKGRFTRKGTLVNHHGQWGSILTTIATSSRNTAGTIVGRAVLAKGRRGKLNILIGPRC